MFSKVLAGIFLLALVFAPPVLLWWSWDYGGHYLPSNYQEALFQSETMRGIYHISTFLCASEAILLIIVLAVVSVMTLVGEEK